MESEKVLRKPVLTEKSYRLQEEENTYTFEVLSEANKIEIRKAVEEKFDVDVEDVRTINTRGKQKRFGRIEGETSGMKKALVKLEEGYRIDLV